MAVGTYNTEQKNLLVAGDHSQQCLRRLEYAQNADQRRDTPLVRAELKELVDLAKALNEKLQTFREKYDDGEFERPDLFRTS